MLRRRHALGDVTMDREGPPPRIPRTVRQQLGITPVEYLGGRHKQSWLVEHRRSRLVARCYPSQPFPDIAYELEVMARLDEDGWPVPVAVAEPIEVDGRTWCLSKFLPGTCRTTNGPGDRRQRGRLLAELHEVTRRLARMGQRRGFGLADEVIGDPELLSVIREYEKLRPYEGHVARWHIDHVRENLTRLDLGSAETIVLHSDFAPWNLLYEGERLTGILDFDATHLNYRVADFALSWRGNQDEVIEGYDEVHKLSDLDWELLVPVFWAWLFIGVKQVLRTTLAENRTPPDLEWQVRHLLRRDGLIGRRVSVYPGRKRVAT